LAREDDALLTREEDARVGLRTFAMERMLTEVIWRVNVRAMGNHQNPAVYACYHDSDTAPKGGRRLNFGSRYTPPRYFCKKSL